MGTLPDAGAGPLRAWRSRCCGFLTSPVPWSWPRGPVRAAGHADPVAQYFAALNRGDAHALQDAWPGEVIVHDPRAGEVRGHHQLRQFVRRNQTWLAGRGARIETVAATVAGDRAVVELLAHLTGAGGQEVAWPVAVVAESPDDRSVVFRSYCSQPVIGQREVRPAILGPGPAHPGDVVGRYLVALSACLRQLACMTTLNPR